MTYEEAKSRIYLHGKTMTEDEALVILDALEKQIPKKPKEGAWYYRCPGCGGSVECFEHHCVCGQTVDWSEVINQEINQDSIEDEEWKGSVRMTNEEVLTTLSQVFNNLVGQRLKAETDLERDLIINMCKAVNSAYGELKKKYVLTKTEINKVLHIGIEDLIKASKNCYMSSQENCRNCPYKDIDECMENMLVDLTYTLERIIK